ncbi:MAG: PQQ-binding-like beta-propeller repeat protein [Verrucomicrobiae bacterium]|nr:PQQ-binding-like beta-propeller repeat protein [Verrucomicrobiae bacterium]
MKMQSATLGLLCFAGLCFGTEQAGQIISASGIKGGLIVHVGCGDGKLTAALRVTPSFLVHGLDTNPSNVEAARRHIQSLGLYGPICVDRWDGQRLPYIENFVNLLVVSSGIRLPDDEIFRVLVPRGVAFIGDRKITKPWPKTMDEWTHYLHDPSNTPVAHDTEIDLLRRMQWLAGPRYSRHHDHMSGASAMVSANGRLFYIFEEAPRASILIPPSWFLYARDAFNGTLLWKRPIERWHEHMYPLKSGPQILPRRLVAIGDKLYVTLNIDDPVSELDAATGQILRTFQQTKVAEEILYFDGVLYLVTTGPYPLRSDPKRIFMTMEEIRADTTGGLWGEAPRVVMAVDAASGKTLWKKETTMMPVTLAVDTQSVYFHDGGNVVCLDRQSGTTRWATETPNQRTLKSSSSPTLLVHDGVVLFSGYAGDTKKVKGESTTMYALDARTGKRLWEAEHLPSGHAGSPKDIFVINGIVWHGETANGSDVGYTVGYDLRTGRLVKKFPPDVKTHWFHQRCYRQKATERFLLFSRTGIEFVDFVNEHWTCHHWVRGPCLYGIMPANGMIYNAPHPCACYLDAKLFGFNALAPASKHWQPKHHVPDAGRLEQGPAFSEIRNAKSKTQSTEDWPTYRGNPARGGYAKTTVPATNLKCAWQTELGGKPSAPVIAEGKVFVAAVDRHEVIALDEITGQKLWSFTAGGRVDSPPTIWQGRVLFGCADGYVYCLRAADGVLAWRFRAAPEDRRHFAYEQIESVWPVHGSVLVQNDTLYCVAGRSMFLDGGLRLLRLDPKTGSKISETIMDENDPNAKTNLQIHVKTLNMPTALADILSSDGRYIYMRTLTLDLQGNRTYIAYRDVKDQQGDDRHLFSPTGFLDDTLWHRTYWVFGRAFASGAGGYYQAGRLTPAGRILVMDDQNVYGYGRLWHYYRWTTPMEFHLFATSKNPEQIRMGQEPPKRVKKDGKPRANLSGTPLLRFAYHWSDETTIQVTAMALANKTLFIAGPPDVVDESQAFRAFGDPDNKQKLAEQKAAFEGRRGALLAAVSAHDGKLLAAYRLDSVPIFDGLAAANRRLYMSTMDGKIVCIAADTGQPLAASSAQVVTPRPPDADKPSDKVPPAETSKAKGKAAKKNTPATPKTTTRSHPDFQILSAATVTASSLGYKLATDPGENGFALKQLATPLTKQATLSLKIQPSTVGRLQTGFLAFGDGTTEERLVKCGFRVRAKKAYIMQSGDKTGTVSTEFISDSDKPVHVEVTVDFANKRLKMTLPGKTLEAPLTAPLQQITHLGYYVMNGTAEFSQIEIK